jgi:hypothetical protein
MNLRVAVVTLAATANWGCSQAALNSERAAQLITDTDRFKREAQFIIQTDAPIQTAFECLAEAEVMRMPLHQFAVKRGWVRYEARRANLGFGRTAFCPAMALTAAGQAASATWTRGPTASSPEGATWSVPIGRRELVGVPIVKLVQDESAQVEFDWKWSPNPTGTALRSQLPQADAFFNTNRQGRASCRRMGSEWRCQMAMWTTPADGGDFQP